MPKRGFSLIFFSFFFFWLILVTVTVCSWLQITVTEEKRLAVAVHQIDAEVSVVPRGAFIKSPRGLVQLNRSFGGKYVYTMRKITI